MTGKNSGRMTALFLAALLALIMLPSTGKAADKKRLVEEYSISSDGRVNSWTEYTYTAQGHRISTRHRSAWDTEINEYNEANKLIKESSWEKDRKTGETRLTGESEYSYTADGKLTCRHSVSYSGGQALHAYEYHDYDAAGRMTGSRYVNTKGEEHMRSRREYSPDGSSREISEILRNGVWSISSENWYNEHDLVTRTITHSLDGTASTSSFEYILDAKGRVLQKTTFAGNGKTIDLYEWNERGYAQHQESISESGSFYYRMAYDQEFDANGKQISVTYTVYDKNGNVTESYLTDEFEYDAEGYRICSRLYETYGYNALQHTTYYVYQYPSGPRPDFASPPGKNGRNQLTLDADAPLSDLQGLTRADVVSRYYGRQLTECVYDADATVYYYDIPGSLRFVFSRRGSDHLQYAFWYSEDFYTDMLMEVSNVMSFNGFEFERASSDPNAIGFYEEPARYSGGGKITLAYLAEGVDDITAPTYLCFSYPPRPENRRTGVSAPVKTAAPAPTAVRTSTPAPTATPEPLPISTAYNDRWTHVWKRAGEPETQLIITENADGSLHADMYFYRMGMFESDFFAFEDPVVDFFIIDSDMGGMLELDQQNDGVLRLYMMSISPDDVYFEYFTENEFVFTLDGQPLPAAEEPEADVTADPVSWQGYWMTNDGNHGELAITEKGNGSVSLAVSFLRTLSFEVDAVPEGSRIEFSTANGEFAGVVTMESDGDLRFAVTDGYILDHETEYYSLFENRTFSFQPAEYEDLSYISPTDTTDYGTDWPGHWVCTGNGRESHLYITADSLGNYTATIIFDTGKTFRAETGQFDENVLDLITDDFGGMLTLNPKKRTILLSEAYTTVDEVSDWLDAQHYIAEYKLVEAYDPQAYSAAPAATAPTAVPARKTERTPDAFTGMAPVPGRPGYLQAVISRADATSWIESKNDPTAFMPFRMYDGDETTSYQFSTKKTKPGKAYLYFEFARPVSLDGLWIKNGFWKITDGNDQYTRNSRVKKMTVDFRYSGSSRYRDAQSFTLKDDKARRDWTALSLKCSPDITGVRIRIDSIYTGSKYKNDVCISEIMFVAKE